MLLRANNVSDFGRRIVDDTGQMVEAGAVGPLDDVILLGAPGDLLRAEHKIFELAEALAGHFHTDHALAALGGETVDVFGAIGGPAAIVHKGLLGFFGFLPQGLEFFGPGEVAVGVPAGEQLFGGGLVELAPLRLKVGRMRAGGTAAVGRGAFIPIDAQPLEAVQDGGEGFGDVTGLVGVVDPQDELAAVLAGEEPVEQGGANAADVQVTGGAGSESGADHGCFSRARGGLRACFTHGRGPGVWEKSPLKAALGGLLFAHSRGGAAF